MNEQWKTIKGYEGKYELSNKGKVRSFLQNKIKELRINHDRSGYCTVVLYKESPDVTGTVHYLILTLFLGLF